MSPSNSPKLRFQASARLQRLLGRDLLPDDNSAVEELVKNAYDSNATEVTITIVRSSGSNSGEIEIRDNGEGLSLSLFRRRWMRAGYSEKSGTPLSGTGRVQVGEKGIGRFAADKLGKRLTVITKPRDASKALEVEFDWSRFDDKRKLLSDILIGHTYVQEPLLERDQSGTILRIQDLRASWDDKAVEALRKRLAQLLNPYGPDQKFKINLIAPRPKLSGQIVPTEIKGADFEWEIKRLANGKVTVRRRRRPSEDNPIEEWGAWERVAVDDSEPRFSKDDFGPVNARFLYFAARPRKNQAGDAVPGVAVYRDGLRVEPAGSAMADWLGLVEKRAKRAGHMPLVPNRLFGFVEINREDNPKLQDATNRRSFVIGPSFQAFSMFLKRRLAELEVQVEVEVAKPRWEKSQRLKNQKLLQARNRTLSIMSLSLAHELRQPLQAIRTASENITGYLNRERVKISQVDTAVDVIGRNVVRIDKHIQFLKELGSGKEESETVIVTDVVAEVLDVFRQLATARNTSLEQGTSTSPDVVFNRSILLATVTNLVLNAIQAIEAASDQEHHTIRVSTTEDTNSIKLIIEDDGPGIPEANRSRLFKRQTTTKQGGMGVGLIVWRDAVQMFGGDLECVNYSNPTQFVVTIPREPSNGQNFDS